MRASGRSPCCQSARERGAALFLTFLLMLVVSGLALAAAVCSSNSLAIGTGQLIDKQVVYIAEAGWQRARQALSAGTWGAGVSPGSTYSESFGGGVYNVTIVDNAATVTENGSTDYTITSQGYVPSAASYVARREIVEYQTSATAANTNRSLTATAAASSTNGSNSASKANDGNTSTKWQASTKGPNEWLSMDHGSSVTLDKMVIKDDGNIASAITIQYSDNNASWTTVGGSSLVESPNNTFTILCTAATHRYFRALFPDVPSGSRAGVKEMESYNTANRTVTFTAPGRTTTEW